MCILIWIYCYMIFYNVSILFTYLDVRGHEKKVLDINKIQIVYMKSGVL